MNRDDPILKIDTRQVKPGLGSRLTTVLKEPLFHFTLVGGLLFAFSVWLGEDSAEPGDTIRLETAELERLTTLWARQWNRVPTADEQRGLIHDHLKEVLLAREAVTLGLDRNDPVIQRRLAQKMAFLLDDTLRTANPGEDVLQAFHRQQPERFQAPAQLAFTQRYFATESAARQALDILRSNAEAEVGEPALLDDQFALTEQPVVANLFGLAFVEALLQAPLQEWVGPVPSSYGFHLVRVDNAQMARTLTFTEARDRVREEWILAEQEKSRQLYFSNLMEKYDVQMDDGLRALFIDDRLTQVSP